MKRVIAASSIVVVVAITALVPGPGLASSRGSVIPAGLAAAIQARLGAGMMRTSSAAQGVPGPLLGLSVALSADGTTALVGAPGVGGGKGAAYIFHAADAGSWSSSGTPVATLTPKHARATGLFGLNVALSADGTIAFVGAPFNGSGVFGSGGAIYAFRASGEDAWTSSSTPKATLAASGGLFVGIGTLALSSDGTTLVTGAPDTNGGVAYVYHASSEGAWASTSTPTATLSNASEVQGDSGVGYAVAISADGTTALVGDSGNPGGGGAYVYHASAEGAWTSSVTPGAILSDSNTGSKAALGNALALSSDGTVALLGAPGINSDTGEADVFHASGEAAWASTSTPTATLANAGGSKGDYFGVNLALSTDGTTALVFAPGPDHRRGAAYVFRAPGEGSWASSDAPGATLTRFGAHADDGLEVGVLSADGATALAGVPGVNLETGAAEIFHVAVEASWASTSTPNATLTDKKLAACVVPKLKWLKLFAAKSALAVGRCRLGKVTKVHAKTMRSRGRVLSQNHKPRARLAINAKVAVKVGK